MKEKSCLIININFKNKQTMRVKMIFEPISVNIFLLFQKMEI